MEELRTCITRHWIHSHEEDTPNARTYRPAGYDFPPARGRVGFDFQAGGKLIYYGIAPVDGSEQLPGRWRIDEPNRVRIDVDHERIRPFVLDVISCDGDRLVVRR